MKIRKKNVISLQDWDDLVQKTYGRVYSLQQQDGCQGRGTRCFTLPLTNDWGSTDFTNDTVPEEVNGKEMGVSFKAWLARDPKAPLKDKEYEGKQWGIDLWWYRNFYPSMEVIADDLYKKGLLEAGEYLIDIDW